MRFGCIGSRSFEAVFLPELPCSSSCRCRVCCHLIAVMIIFHGHRGYYSDGQSFSASRASFPGVVVLNGGTNLFVCVTSLVPLRLPFPLRASAGDMDISTCRLRLRHARGQASSLSQTLVQNMYSWKPRARQRRRGFPQAFSRGGSRIARMHALPSSFASVSPTTKAVERGNARGRGPQYLAGDLHRERQVGR